MREMISLQPRFEFMRGKRATNLLQHRRFRAAYDFMMLQAEVGQADEAIAKFWTDVQTQSTEDRAASFGMKSQRGGKRKPRRRRKRKPAAES